MWTFNKMKPAEFVKLLNATPFEGDLGMLHGAENAFREHMRRYKGYAALSAGFIRFFLETAAAFNKEIQPKVTELVSAQHALFVEKLVHGFLTLRAAQVAAHSGYPMQGYVLLRNVYDDCVLASAVLQGLTDFEELAGANPGQKFDAIRMRKNRIATERRVRAKMDGQESGLSAETLRWLAKLDEMYDMETHGGRLSTAHNMDWIKGRSPLPIVPRFAEEKAAIFMNRFLEVAWLVHRLLPLIQLPDHALSEGWAARWRLVDGAFNHVVASLAKDLGKPVFSAVRDFVDKKFPFSEASRFPL